MGYDNKYGKVTTEFGTIGEDEPVVVFRARDLFLPETLTFYHHRCWQGKSPDKHLKLIQDTMDKVDDWQNANLDKVQVPQSKDYEPRK